MDDADLDPGERLRVLCFLRSATEEPQESSALAPQQVDEAPAAAPAAPAAAAAMEA